MPSSLIFVGLVVLWLLILVPTVARRQQEVARLSPALLGGRVLERPMRHRIPEVGEMERSGPTTVGELAESRELPGTRRDARPDDTGYDDTGYDDTGYDTAGYDRADYDGAGDDTEIDDDGRVRRAGDLPDEPGDRDGAVRAGRPRADVRDSGADPGNRYDGSDRHPGDLDDGDVDPRDLDPRDLDESDLADGDLADLADGDPDGAHPDEIHPDDAYDDAYDDGFDDVAPRRYRPGRGGFDPEAAAAAAHAKYAFRQRVVLAMLVLLLAGAVAALLVSSVFWWVTGAVGVALGGYLTYLRRQVRIEEAIRARRGARLSAVRRDPERYGPDAHADVHPDVHGDHPYDPVQDGDRTGDPAGVDDRADAPDPAAPADDTGAAADDGDGDWTADDGEPTRVRGTGEPLGVLPARRRTVDGSACTEHESSLPRLAAAPPPPVPAGTSLVDVHAEEEGDEEEMFGPHRRAAGE